ncbi:AraC-like DNA-binding protein [Chitinophaga niastensis]|uniref:AraC-like DNA-binding protein n=1 Tax=Chitinophaga niastensis TaxID=536980 RepID=A0A2P8HDQ0_CHINA|nr:helix-turn-helix domain-containing protein [Chitinophaga niastensis]PSL44343.1 AraC-like DNA-binding protein [Chitinophaga niastensis]
MPADRHTKRTISSPIHYMQLLDENIPGIRIATMQSLMEENRALLDNPIRTNAFHIFWFKTGGHRLQINFSAVDIVADTILFVRKDSIHLLGSDNNYEGLSISFTENFFCQTITDQYFLQDNALFSNHAALTGIQPGERLDTFIGILTTMQEEIDGPPDKFTTDILRNLLRYFLMLATREKGTVHLYRDSLNRDAVYTQQYISMLQNEFSHQKKVAAYASMLHISEKRLHLATTSILGKAPKQLIDEKVIQEAKRQIAHSSQLIKEIGYELGFQQPSNFIKYFIKHTGLSPTDFRKKVTTDF